MLPIAGEMQAPDLETTAARTIKLGVITLGAALIAGAWELIALQAPGSPLYIGMLPGPVGALRELCVTLGLLALAAGALMPRAYRDASTTRARVASSLIASGVVLSCGAQAYGAAEGMHGVQISDLRADAPLVFFLRHGGLGLFALGWIDLGMRVLRRPAAT